jgi:hypothetical protein
MAQRTPRAPRRAPNKSPFFWLVVTTGCLALGLYVFGVSILARYGTITNDFGWRAVSTPTGSFVADVDPNGPAAGTLRVGDRVVAVGDDERLRGLPIEAGLARVPAGGAYAVHVSRDGADLRAELQAREARSHKKLVGALVPFAVSVAFFAVGLMFGLIRPDERVPRLGWAACFLTALGMLDNSLAPFRSYFVAEERLLGFAIAALKPLEFAFAYHFYSILPTGVPEGRGWVALRRVFYGACAAMLVPHWLILGYSFEVGRPVDFILSVSGLVVGWVVAFEILIICTLAAMVAVAIRNYLLVEEGEPRRRIRWVVYGTAAAVGPSVALGLFALVAYYTGNERLLLSNQFFMLSQAVILLLVLIPLSLGYAGLKHRILGVDVVVRRGVQYLLARGVLQVVLSLPLVGLVYSIASNPHRTVAEIVSQNWTFIALLVAAAVSLKFRARLGEWVDRKFFRAAYDREQVLLRLVDDVKQHDSLAEISRRVSIELHYALHPTRTLVAYRQDGSSELTLTFSSGRLTEDFRIPEDSALVRALDGETAARDVSLEGVDLPEDEEALLADNGIALVVPITGAEGRLVGLLLLGEKRSEEPYTARDRRMLELVASQMGIRYENLQLLDRVARDHRMRVEVLGRIDRENINLVKECPSCGTCYDSSAGFCHNDGVELTYTLPVERVVDGKYRLERLLGRGGMGAVYEGVDVRLNRRVAIKVLIGRMFGDRAALRRFEREAQASARLNHPNVITVYDYGAIGADGAFLVMELLHGRTLRSELQRAGAIPPHVTARWFDQVFEAIKAAHMAGVVHRDLKPENVMVATGPDGADLVKVLDFGLAKVHLEGGDPNSLTVPGTIMGTFGYMPPEQLAGADVDHRCDVFALGVMVAEALTGRKPFAGRSLGELTAAISRETFTISADGVEVRALERLLRRAMAPDRADRFASVAEMQDALIPAILRCQPIVPGVASEPGFEPTLQYGETEPA